MVDRKETVSGLLTAVAPAVFFFLFVFFRIFIKLIIGTQDMQRIFVKTDLQPNWNFLFRFTSRDLLTIKCKKILFLTLQKCLAVFINLTDN